MKILDRHIAGYVIWGTLLALFVLLTLFTFTDFVEDLDSVGRGTYTMGGAIERAILRSPTLAFRLFPTAALIGSLIGLGVLASNSELMVVRASGVSVSRIVVSVLKAAAVLMVIALIVGEVIAPVSGRLAEERRTQAISDKVTERAGEGFWMRDGGSFINVRQVLPDDSMVDVHIYELDGNRRLRVATHAASARYENEEWLLEDLVQSVISEAGIERHEVTRAQWSSVFEPDLVDVITVSPESLSALGLYKYLGYLRDNNLSTDRHELALWVKLMAPLSTGVMIFLSIPLVLGRLRSVNIGQRIVVGILVGVIFHIAQQTSSQMGIVYGMPPSLSAILPTMVFLGFGLWLVRSVR